MMSNNWFENLTAPVAQSPSTKKLEAPFGYIEPSTYNKKSSSTQIKPSKQSSKVDDLKSAKAWEIATGPAKQLPSTIFMNYMSGNSLQIIPITMTITLFTGVFSAISGVKKVFHGLETEKNKDNVYLAKVTFLLMQVLTLAYGIWKLNNMGVIPNKRSDWIAWEVTPSYVERLL
ncbi:hypothetical protein WICPIJ_006595 [Wickerhamomyces pijperi]|uniref:ER membrane protein complex subunit 4 n=1 Tax=Wickerhamomyces pijperi TaxID=599730 RepID=A0A9P8Q1E7_WICPI|nr:hypothetical protein WICPIJ_006595 [Wickerhamomyces pijperi]